MTYKYNPPTGNVTQERWELKFDAQNTGLYLVQTVTERIIALGLFKTDAEHICDLHNAALARPEPAAGERPRWRVTEQYEAAPGKYWGVENEYGVSINWLNWAQAQAVANVLSIYAPPSPAQSGETGLLEEAKDLLRRSYGSAAAHRPASTVLRDDILGFLARIDAAQEEESKSE